MSGSGAGGVVEVYRVRLSLSLKPAGAGHSVLFTAAYRLLQELLAAKRDLALPRQLRKLDNFDFLSRAVSGTPSSRKIPKSGLSANAESAIRYNRPQADVQHHCHLPLPTTTSPNRLSESPQGNVLPAVPIVT